MIAILSKEPERDRLVDILANEDRPVLSAVTYYETMLIASTRRGTANLDDLAQNLETIEAEIVPFDADQTRTAQAAYMRYGEGIDRAARLNLCDCVAYALAKQLAVSLLYKGSDFGVTYAVPAS